MSLPKRQKPIVLDFISVNLIIVAVVVYLYASTFTGSPAATRSLTAVVILIAGLVMAFLVGKLQPDFKLSRKEWTNIVTWTAVSMGAIMAVNLIVKLKFDVTPIDNRLFSVLIGVSEEMFFRVFLTSWLVLLTGRLWGIVLGSSVFTVYHFSVYSAMPSALLIIFSSGLIIGYAFVESRRASVPMLAHALINMLSVA